MDPAKLKVVELRAELSKRGLDTKGNKPVLVERLRQAIESEPPTEISEKAELKSDSEDEGSTDSKQESARLPPRTPSRSSRHTSREPTTPVRTPTRRSSSRSSTSRQSPAKTSLAESLNEAAASTLEPIVEEDKVSPKKEVVPTPAKKEPSVSLVKKDPPPTPKKEPLPTPSPKKDVISTPSPKKEEVLPETPKKVLVTPPTPKKEATPRNENAVQNESPRKKEEPAQVIKDDNKLETVKEAEKHILEKSQEITRRDVDDVCRKPAEKVNVQSPVKESPTKPAAQSPLKLTAQSPVKSPIKPVTQSPVKESVKSPIKPVTQSPIKEATKSPVQAIVQSPVKPVSTDKVEQSPVKTVVSDSPNKKLKTDNEESMETEKMAEVGDSKDDAQKSFDEAMEDEENDKDMDTDEQGDDKTDKSDEKSERKRKRSPSPQEEAPRAPPVARPENEPNIDENALLLSWYDSDLNLVINPTNYFSASTMQGDGFNFMWAGARVSHGFSKGKIVYEVKISNEFDNMAAAANITNISGAIPADDEKSSSLLRVGWSTFGTSLQLGEEKLSYGYEGTGKKCTNNEFTEYGKSFGKNDVVGCYIDFETDGKVTLTYSINGESQGTAFVVEKEELGDKALFPHILGKNCTFTVNLGQEEPWSSSVLDGYVFADKIEPKDRIAGPRRPDKRENCEVILLCGLPFSGKTAWANKHAASNPEKLYTILGTHNLMQKMKLGGVPLKENFKGNWDAVVEKCSRALTKLLESAPSRRRNYILDQPVNIYASAQKRKMRNFYGFHRKAAIFILSDDEFKSCIEKRKESKDIKEHSLLELKANISAPIVGESFEEVEWTELAEEEGKKLIEIYNKEGKAAGFGENLQQSKRSRYDNDKKDRNNRDSRDHRRPNFNDRRSSGSWRGGPGGGWRDSGRMRGGPMRHSAGYGPPPGPWRARGSPLPPRSGDGQRRTGTNDRRPGNDRNRPAGGGHRSGSGWNAVGYQGSQAWSGQGNWQGQSQSGWSGQQSGSGNWNQQQQAWGGSAAWKNYGQNSYGQSASTTGYGQTTGSYGNGSWNNWNPQYYNQYWGGQQQSSQTSGQTQTTGQTQSKK